jgi:DNA-directed RNA polymerase beta subunit
MSAELSRKEFFGEPLVVDESSYQGKVNDSIYFPESFSSADVNEDLSEIELSASGKLLKKYLLSEGPGDHHIEVYDNWLSRNASKNVHSLGLKFQDGRTICFEDLKIFPPRYTRDGKVLSLTPKYARENGVTYGSDWHVDIVLRKDNCSGKELGRIKSVCIGNVPVMVKSKYCILHKKTKRELALFGEDPNDPGGYFIVEGNEKVVLLQEQLAANKIFIMNMDTKSTPEARMTVSTAKGTALVRLIIHSTKNSIEMIIPSLGMKQEENQKKKRKPNSINVFGIFSIFGFTDHQEIKDIISLFLKPDRIKKSLLKLTGTFADFDSKVNYGNMIVTMMNKPDLQPEEIQREIATVMENDLFPHLNNLPPFDGETIQEKSDRVKASKIYLLATMVAKFIEHFAGFRSLDNRDSWSNKRVVGAGRMMEQLFRNAWKKTLQNAQGSIDSNNTKDFEGAVEKIRHSLITDTFRDSFITNNWGVKGMLIRNNIAQTLVRDSVVATFAHINTVDVKISRTDRQQSLRLVQMDQWGFICPVSTPEGENAGLLKNLSKTAKVSVEC